MNVLEDKFLKNKELLENNICGKKIVKINYIHDYLQIFFDDNSILNLNNKVTMSGNIDLVIDKIIKNVILNNEILKLISVNDFVIEMTMKHEDYNGPEALEYYNGDLIIIE